MSKLYYRARKPIYSNWEWFKFIAIRTIFPPIVVWDLIKIGANKLFGKAIGRGFFGDYKNSKSLFSLIKEPSIDDDNKSSKDYLTFVTYFVVTPDRAPLETVEIEHHSQKNILPKDKNYIIHFTSIGGYSNPVNMVEDANYFKCNVIGFKHRYVEDIRKLRSMKDLIVDGIAQVQRLLDQSVSAENIILNGFSLGGGVASAVARHFHQLGEPIKLFNTFSFSSASAYIVEEFITSPYESDNNDCKSHFKKMITRFFLNPLVKLIASLVKWELDAADAYKSIPQDCREYIVVKGKHSMDGVIPPRASLGYLSPFSLIFY